METTLSKEQVEAIYNIVAKEVDVPLPQITADARIMDDLGADSLAVVELSMALEDRFNVTIPDEEWEHVATVGDICESLAKLIGSR